MGLKPPGELGIVVPALKGRAIHACPDLHELPRPS